jgi:hypothetical protein
MTHMIGAETLDKPAVGVSYQNGRVTVVGERMAARIPMPQDSLFEVRHFNHWHYHDVLYHSDDHDSEYHSCEVCEEFGETEL